MTTLNGLPRSSERILPTLDATLVMKRETLQEIVPRTNNPSIERRDIMLIPPNKMDQKTKDS